MRVTSSRSITTLAILALLAGADSGHARGDSVGDPSFESSPAGTSIGGTLVFTSTGTWTIDSGMISAAENSIIPLDGDQMLRFTQTPQNSADIYQLLDTADLAPTLELSAYFNATEVRTFSVGFVAFDESRLPISINAGDVAGRGCDFASDGDPGTWERVRYRFTLPDTARFVAIGISSEITGTPSYADVVSLTTLCPDVDGNGQVGFSDVIDLLSDWGPCPPCVCPGDITVNGTVGFEDLLKVLAAWGVCP